MGILPRANTATTSAPAAACPAKALPWDQPPQLAVAALAGAQPISHLAAAHDVSRKFVYQQADKAQQTLDHAFDPDAGEDHALFHLPLTKAWPRQLTLGLVLICHSPWRGAHELLRDVFDYPLSLGAIHDIVAGAMPLSGHALLVPNRTCLSTSSRADQSSSCTTDSGTKGDRYPARLSIMVRCHQSMGNIRMARVWIPSLLRDLTGGRDTVSVLGSSVRQVIDELDRLHPGVRNRLCDGDALRPGLAVVVDSEVARLGLLQTVGPDSEVHFLPAIAGG
jgi:molybdopterin converting factor small subunit